ncbi:hypothetical protein DVH24_011232 [Malus domestica]|uniref:DNA topoisomerase I catalytic core eukaryotic-type domain-containing protein n=1 Tax=Malus domestica TaxID=3750 RepID=A0A498JVD2_MALDO|nr:hypothetical protein DVH24_011232 [Malus domestica]
MLSISWIGFALRAGIGMGEDEADTVDCCTLKVEHFQAGKRGNDHLFDKLDAIQEQKRSNNPLFEKKKQRSLKKSSSTGDKPKAIT